MFRLDILAATRTLEKTMPFILYRLLLCLGVGLTFLLATLIGAGTIIAFSALAKNSSGPSQAWGPFWAFWPAATRPIIFEPSGSEC